MVCSVKGEKHADDSTPDASFPEPTISQSRALAQGIAQILRLEFDAACHCCYTQLL